MFLINILQITGFCFFAISYPDLTLQPLGRGRSGYKVSLFEYTFKFSGVHGT